MDILLEAAVRATLLAAAVAILLAALRIRSPRIAHRAWAGIALILLLLPAFVMWGPHAAIPLPRDSGAWMRAQSPADARDGAGSPRPAGAAAAAPVPASMSASVDWDRVLLLLYATGVLLLLLRLAIGVRLARALIGEATVVGGRLASRHCSTPVTVGLLTPTVILPLDWTEWPEADLAAVLAHEEEHARARDPLASFITLAARAVFWFHPLAWWLARRVSMLAEQACDAAVLARGHDVDAYAAALLKFARLQAGARSRVTITGTAMPGTALKRRLRMLDDLPTGPTPWARMLAIAAAYAATAVVSVAATPSLPGDAAAASREPTALVPHAAAASVQSPALVPDAAAASTELPAQTGRVGWQVVSSERFDIHYGLAQAGRVRDLAHEAERAYADLSADLKYDLTDRITLVLVDRDRDIGGGRISAVDFRPLSVIVISTESLDAQPGILLHELTHSFALQIVPATARAAPWLIEGLAEHQRGAWTTESVRGIRAALASAWIPQLEALGSADRYWSHALFDFIAATYGEEGIRRCLFALRSRTHLREAIPAAFGTPLAAFDQAFRAYVTTRFGEP